MLVVCRTPLELREALGEQEGIPQPSASNTCPELVWHEAYMPNSCQHLASLSQVHAQHEAQLPMGGDALLLDEGQDGRHAIKYDSCNVLNHDAAGNHRSASSAHSKCVL